MWIIGTTPLSWATREHCNGYSSAVMMARYCDGVMASTFIRGRRAWSRLVLYAIARRAAIRARRRFEVANGASCLGTARARRTDSARVHPLDAVTSSTMRIVRKGPYQCRKPPPDWAWPRDPNGPFGNLHPLRSWPSTSPATSTRVRRRLPGACASGKNGDGTARS